MSKNRICLIPKLHIEDSDSCKAVSCLQMDILSEGREVGKVIVNRESKAIDGDLIWLGGPLSEAEIAHLWQKAVSRVLLDREPVEPIATKLDFYPVNSTSPRRFQRVLSLRDLLAEADWNETQAETSVEAVPPRSGGPLS